MNQIVDNWKVSKEDYLPDGLEIHGEKRIMAVRKKPQTEYVPDSSCADDTDLRLCHLSKKDFSTYIRFIKTTGLENVKLVRTETFNALKRVQAKRDVEACPAGIPSGSDQADVGTLVRWLRSVEKTHEKAIRQLIMLDAACCQRTK